MNIKYCAKNPIIPVIPDNWKPTRPVVFVRYNLIKHIHECLLRSNTLFAYYIPGIGYVHKVEVHKKTKRNMKILCSVEYET